jgi:nucleotide-binding universal stress UspA family protein
MSAPRRFLVALAGTEDAALPEALVRVVGAGAEVEVALLHVAEAGARELAAYDPLLRRGPWPLPKKAEIEQRLTEADDEGAAALLAAWHEKFALALPGTKITHEVAQGRPEEQIIAAAQRLNADAVILCARPRTGLAEPGPRSVGHVARFVVDHSPVPVLLVRSSRTVS